MIPLAKAIALANNVVAIAIEIIIAEAVAIPNAIVCPANGIKNTAPRAAKPAINAPINSRP